MGTLPKGTPEKPVQHLHSNTVSGNQPGGRNAVTRGFGQFIWGIRLVFHRRECLCRHSRHSPYAGVYALPVPELSALTPWTPWVCDQGHFGSGTRVTLGLRPRSLWVFDPGHAEKPPTYDTYWVWPRPCLPTGSDAGLPFYNRVIPTGFVGILRSCIHLIT